MTDPTRGVFRKEGDYWIITYANQSAALENAVGLEYLALLLRHPQQEIHVLNLILLVPGSDVTMIGTLTAPTVGLAAPHSDPSAPVNDARVAYTRRVQELGVELRRAQQQGDALRVDRLRLTIDLIALRRAGALGAETEEGREEESVTARARAMVAHSLDEGIETLRGVHPGLAQHLAAAIKTGDRFSYLPPLERRVVWST